VIRGAELGPERLVSLVDRKRDDLRVEGGGGGVEPTPLRPREVEDGLDDVLSRERGPVMSGVRDASCRRENDKRQTTQGGNVPAVARPALRIRPGKNQDKSAYSRVI
jgi:hypothetical protein